MAIMDVIRRMGEKRKETKEKFKQMQEDDKLNTMLEERKKSSNQRELEKYYKDKEEIFKQKSNMFLDNKSNIPLSGGNNMFFN